MSSTIIANARLLAFSLVDNVEEVTKKENEVLKEKLGSSFASVGVAPEVSQLAPELAPEGSEKMHSDQNVAEVVLEC